MFEWRDGDGDGNLVGLTNPAKVMDLFRWDDAWGVTMVDGKRLDRRLSDADAARLAAEVDRVNGLGELVPGVPPDPAPTPHPAEVRRLVCALEVAAQESGLTPSAATVATLRQCREALLGYVGALSPGMPMDAEDV